jgi:uncharacterized protein (DUF302 family)
MRLAFLACVLAVFLCGCTTVKVPNYIPSNHPYSQKMYGDYEDIVAAVREVLVKNGWKVQGQMDPSVYERAQGGDSSDRDILLFTNVKQHSMFLYSSYTHLNVFIHPTAEGAEVEIRYAKTTPLFIKQFQGSKNDKLAKKLLSQIERELLEKK